MFTWIEEQIGKLINFIVGAKEDLHEFDEKMQEKIAKYHNKECGKAAIFGAIIAVAATLAVEALFRTL